MPVERLAGSASLVDVLDRVLGRGLRWDTNVHKQALQDWPPASTRTIVVKFVEVRTPTPHSRGA
ncbi:hypothetical protein BHS09_07675 [Myxococcus xanthus]|uniref:Uncharacterized protein n=1 Tax=Myxococcus xanthus TaxID=34 RepID=A0AAE6FXD7_MYXXA|nr:hypothetical protein [Myxococcus xanthus]QDE66900.1 hypothetical protein BHS09_07675 [Myxococcus xanthus]QDE74173.1 hypothetical protein BHS08_07680 [Myxococcus xanthus]